MRVKQIQRTPHPPFAHAKATFSHKGRRGARHRPGVSPIASDFLPFRGGSIAKRSGWGSDEYLGVEADPTRLASVAHRLIRKRQRAPSKHQRRKMHFSADAMLGTLHSKSPVGDFDGKMRMSATADMRKGREGASSLAPHARRVCGHRRGVRPAACSMGFAAQRVASRRLPEKPPRRLIEQTGDALFFRGAGNRLANQRPDR